MGLSSNVLWHQTSFEGLKKILEHRNIKYSYSLESIYWKGSHKDVAFPMISCCDIPLADLSDYLTHRDGKLTGKYGKYAIGFKREWGKKNGFSPVWYRDKNATTLRNEMDAFKDVLTKDSFSLNKNQIILWETIANTKNYEGKLIKYKFESYRFFDEREVRAVPLYEDLCASNIKPFMSESVYKQYKKEHGSSLISNMIIAFEYSDIAYLLYSSRNLRTKVMGLLANSTNKITFLSYDQIMKDIVGESHSRKQ